MTIALTSPITGGAQTGFTSPTYTIVTDYPPSNNGKQYAVSALGGTQSGVDVHSVSKPFTITVLRPANLKALPAANPVTGVIKTIPKNTYKIIVRKGAVPGANQNPITAVIRCDLEIPAGTDTNEPEELRAMISAFIGALNQISAGLGDTVTSGILG